MSEYEKQLQKLEANIREHVVLVTKILCINYTFISYFQIFENY